MNKEERSLLENIDYTKWKHIDSGEFQVAAVMYARKNLFSKRFNLIIAILPVK